MCPDENKGLALRRQSGRGRLVLDVRQRAPYGLRFRRVYPRRFWLSASGPYRGHYPIVEFEIWPFQPRVKLSLSTMRRLIDIFSGCCCNVVCLGPARLLSASSLASPSFFPRSACLPVLLRPVVSLVFLLPLGPSRAAASYKASAEYF